MKKYIITGIIAISATAAFGQSFQTRFNFANRDTIRTQIRMAAIDIAADYIDTSTNANRRLCSDILSQPTAGYWVDYFAFQIAANIKTATPTDTQIRNAVLQLWSRVGLLNTRR